jgi:PAS domain S-box-containing protein
LGDPTPASPLAADPLTLWRACLEQAPVPMALLEGPHYTIRYANRAFCHVLGKAPEAVIGRSFSDAVPQGDRCQAVLDQVSRTGQSARHMESAAAQPSPPPFWSWAVWPLRHAEEAPVSLIIQIMETTQLHQQTTAVNEQLMLSSVRQHELTETLENLNVTLEERVSERTQAFEQSETRLRALATELNLAEQRERKRLAIELHDYLAQLLVLGRISLTQAKKAGLPPGAHTFVLETEDCLNKALTYCRTLMAELSPPILHERGLPASLQWLAEHMKRHEITVTVDIQEPLEMVLPQDSAVLLYQSVRELLINVAKHGAVKEATVRMARTNKRLELIVQDPNGFDLAAAAVSQAYSPLSMKFGLFSIHERMKALGGNFEIQSAPQQGTTARMTLPLSQSENRERLQARQIEEAPRGPVRVPPVNPAPAASVIRVLLVDDHAILREGVRSIVMAHGHLQVIGEAQDGVEAVALAHQLSPDVVVMDINMPKMDGIEATRQIKKNRPDIIVIGLSVNQSPDTELRMKAAGATELLGKESAADTLCQIITEAVSRHRKWSARQAC